MRLTLCATALFTAVGLATRPATGNFALNRFLLRPVYLIVFGYMIAYLGGYEIDLRRRLALLKEVTAISNPRFGVGQTINVMLHKLRDFYDAAECLLVMSDLGEATPRLYRLGKRHADAPVTAEPLPEGVANLLLSLPAEHAALARPAPVWKWWRRQRESVEYDLTTGLRIRSGEDLFDPILALLEAESLITTPLRSRNRTRGRLYLAASRRSAFDKAEIGFLKQVMEQVLPIIEYIQLIDRLASDAAEGERMRIARGLHDSVLQPYIGLHLGLSAVLKKIEQDGGGVARDVEVLIERTRAEIEELRRYARGFRYEDAADSGLTRALQRFAVKFSGATGLRVEIVSAQELALPDRLATEVFEMVAEGLSNVVKHTESSWARIALERDEASLMLQIENEGSSAARGEPFLPRSINERAEAMGGKTSVVTRDDGGSRIVVEVPL